MGEMKAGHGRRPQTAGTAPRALPSGPRPHPARDKEPEQEFVPGLVSRQGFVIPALSGMRSAHGKLPAASQEEGGTSRPHPAGCSVPALRPPLLPPAPQLQAGSSRNSPGVSASSLCGAEGAGNLPAPRFPRWSVGNGGAGSHKPAPGAPEPGPAPGSAMPRDLGGFQAFLCLS